MRFQGWVQSAVTAEEEKAHQCSKWNSAIPTRNWYCRSRDDLPGLPGLFQSGTRPQANNVIAYLNEQINKIKPQALASSQAAVDYGYENGLGILDGLPLAGRVSGAGVSKDGGGQGISSLVAAAASKPLAPPHNSG